MEYNAYIVDWTMNHYQQLQDSLAQAGFRFAHEPTGESLLVAVPFDRLDEFAALGQKHLNAPQNYIDVQYPGRQETVIIFQRQQFRISNTQENEQVKAWAIAQGLPPEQAEWGTSFV